MLPTEKKFHRGPVLKTAIKGMVPEQSVDDLLRGLQPKVHPWESITVLGAQLSRPPYDPYREIIDTSLRLGRNGSVVLLNSPIIVGYDGENSNAYASLHQALENLAQSGTVHALVTPVLSPEQREGRKYVVVLTSKDKDARAQIEHADAVNVEYTSDTQVEEFVKYGKPILVTTKKTEDIARILDSGADALIVDVGELHSDSIAQLRSIALAKQGFANYFRGSEVNRVLLFRGIPNDAGSVVKAIAMGAISAHGVVYDLPAIIAQSIDIGGNGSGYDLQKRAKPIENVLAATLVEIKQLVAAAGYSIHTNISHDVLRTSNPEVSLATGITMEGLNVPWYEYHRRILLGEMMQRGIDPSKVPSGTLEQMVLELIKASSDGGR